MTEEVKIGKITAHIGVGESGEKLNKAQGLLENITGKQTVKTRGKAKVPKWDVREGKAMGIKTTLRGEEAEKFLKRTFEAIGNEVKKSSFDKQGNLNFGIEEYIDLPDVKYNPDIGMFGLDVNVTMEKRGYRVKKRKNKTKKVGKDHILTPEESIEYLTDRFNLEVIQ